MLECASVAADDEEPGRVALRQRLLRDQLLRQVVVEVGELESGRQRFSSLAVAGRSPSRVPG